MRVADSIPLLLNTREKETPALVRMTRDRPRSAAAAMASPEDAGEVSDGGSAASLEEISADDFNRDAYGQRSRVWMGYPSVSRNYGTALFGFAWSQAVQNKPLGLDLMPMNSAKEGAGREIIEDGSEESGGAVEKEEGELEEGEIGMGLESTTCETIDLDSDAPEKESPGKESADQKECDAKESEIVDLDQRVSLTLEDLETVTEEEAEKSFECTCSRLRKSFESLKVMFSEMGPSIPLLDTLVQQAFNGIKTVNSVICSSSFPKREQNKDLLLRLLVHIKNQYSNMLTPSQVNELCTYINLLGFEDANNVKKQQSGSRSNEKGIAHPTEKPGVASHSLDLSEKLWSESKVANSFGGSNWSASLPKLDIPTLSRNILVSPLLDPQAAYDADSLPSPTRSNTLPLPLPKPICFEGGTAVSTTPAASKNVESEDTTLHPYTTDALKAVSSYQQKYGQSSLFASGQLPSPTPSEEGNNNDDDTICEVSSASIASKTAPLNAATSTMQVLGFSNNSTVTDSLRGVHLDPIKHSEVLGFGPNPNIKPASKSRDPRLRFKNSEICSAVDPHQPRAHCELRTPKDGIAGKAPNSRKHKAVDESMPAENILKKQRNGFINSKDTQMISGRGGWLEEGTVATFLNDGVKLNVNTKDTKVGMGKAGNQDIGSDSRLSSNINSGDATAQNVQTLQMGSTSVYLPSLLKDIAVNPTMLMQLLQMEQKRLTEDAKPKNAASSVGMTNASSVNIAAGVIPTADVVRSDGQSTKAVEIGQNPSLGLHMPSQTAAMPQNSQNENGRIRMKPRDPRRFLHSNVAQNTDVVSSEPMKTNGTLTSDSQASKDCLTGQGEAQTGSSPSQSSTVPDIARQLNKNLTNFSGTAPNFPMTVSVPVAPLVSSQQAPSTMNKVDMRPTVEERNANNSLDVAGGPVNSALPSTNPWGDVAHLLDGYDDQQKAAFQSERARRIEEQNKMFAGRKLCLVLDLDHTLLNSAKFLEVDPVHEEILRRKEEQDRGRLQRHLYYFPHMGMWTKLRPGIWNFLEKASKLYELHLYTMGNKLYATEMAKVLDPTGALFAGRVISRGDDADPDGDDKVPKSKDLDGVLGMESAVVIIDDSVRVWPHNKNNLIVVERYLYFPCSVRQFGLYRQSLLESDCDERPEDGTLASISAVIELIHRNFFSCRSLNNDVDVRNILASEQRKVLTGCRIVFSRVFPVGEANPHLHHYWQMAEQFGAVCTNQIDEHVTHVVAACPGTDKVNWALAMKKFAVSPHWLEASVLLYRRANEFDFMIQQPPPLNHTNELSSIPKLKNGNADSRQL